jgi:hypothetical protein
MPYITLFKIRRNIFELGLKDSNSDDNALIKFHVNSVNNFKNLSNIIEKKFKIVNKGISTLLIFEKNRTILSDCIISWKKKYEYFINLISNKKDLYLANGKFNNDKFRNMYYYDDNKLLLRQFIKYQFSDSDHDEFDVRILIIDKDGHMLNFDEIMALKMEFPKLDLLKYAYDQIQVINDFYTFCRFFIKDKTNGYIDPEPKKRMKKLSRMKYQFIGMADIKKNFSCGYNELYYLSKNKNLDKETFIKYFSNFPYDKISSFERDVCNYKSPYLILKENLLNNDSIDDDLIHEYIKN